MSVARIIVAIFCCGLGTAIGWWAIKASWLLTFLCGPLQHLGLSLARLDNLNEYLDGVSRVETADYLLASLQVAIWFIGIGAVFYWFKGESKAVVVTLVCGWVLVGALNVYLFAIRSV